MIGINNLQKSKIIKLEESVDYSKGGIVSKRIYRRDSSTSILFSISIGEEIENNRVQNETFILNLEGSLEIRIEDELHTLKLGEIIIIPALKLYEIKALTDSKYQLIEM
ncbi:MAG: hypothetical protein ACRCZ9_05510 [Fusobacteriaceae bacterium]